MKTQNIIKKRIKESIDVKNLIMEKYIDTINNILKEIIKRIKKGGTIFSCGNGGSYCDALHLTEELLVRYYKNRPPIKALTLEMNPGAITAASNDFSYKESFSRSTEAFVKKNDVFIAISTSGNSPNILNAIKIAKKNGAWIIGFSGKTGGKMKKYCNQIINVPSTDTPRIQEVHILIIHILCELIEENMY